MSTKKLAARMREAIPALEDYSDEQIVQLMRESAGLGRMPDRQFRQLIGDQEAQTVGEGARRMLQEFGQGASFGWADEMAGIAAPVAQRLLGAADVASTYLSGGDLDAATARAEAALEGDLYGEVTDVARRERDIGYEENPIGMGLAGLAGATAGGIGFGGGGRAALGLPAMPAGLRGLAATGAAEGAVAGAGEADGDLGDRLAGAALGAGLGAALPPAAAGVGRVASGLPVARFARGLGNLSEDLGGITRGVIEGVADPFTGGFQGAVRGGLRGWRRTADARARRSAAKSAAAEEARRRGREQWERMSQRRAPPPGGAPPPPPPPPPPGGVPQGGGVPPPPPPPPPPGGVPRGGGVPPPPPPGGVPQGGGVPPPPGGVPRGAGAAPPPPFPGRPMALPPSRAMVPPGGLPPAQPALPPSRAMVPPGGLPALPPSRAMVPPGGLPALPPGQMVVPPPRLPPGLPGGPRALPAPGGPRPLLESIQQASAQARSSVVPIRELREASGLDPAAFDRELLNLMEQGRVDLFEHDRPLDLTPEQLVRDERGRAFNAVSLRDTGAPTDEWDDLIRELDLTEDLDALGIELPPITRDPDDFSPQAFGMERNTAVEALDETFERRRDLDVDDGLGGDFQRTPGDILDLMPNTRRAGTADFIDPEDAVSARARMRGLMRQYGLRSETARGREFPSSLEVNESMSAAGVHHWDGSIELNPKVAQLLVSDNPTMRLIGTRTLLHEEIHGAGPVVKTAYRDSGVVTEEVATEVLARRMLRDETGEELRPSGGLTGSYQEPIDDVIDAMGLAVFPREAFETGVRDGMKWRRVRKSGLRTLENWLERAATHFKRKASGVKVPAELTESFADSIIRTAPMRMSVKQRDALRRALLDMRYTPKGSKSP